MMRRDVILARDLDGVMALVGCDSKFGQTQERGKPLAAGVDSQTMLNWTKS